MSYSFTESLQWRYATKKFDPTKKLSDADFDTLMESLRLAPSSLGMQPWKFLIINNSSIRGKLKPVCWNQSQIVDASHLIGICARVKTDEASVDAVLADVVTRLQITPEKIAQRREMVLGYLAAMNNLENTQWALRQC